MARRLRRPGHRDDAGRPGSIKAIALSTQLRKTFYGTIALAALPYLGRLSAHLSSLLIERWLKLGLRA